MSKVLYKKLAFVKKIYLIFFNASNFSEAHSLPLFMQSMYISLATAHSEQWLLSNFQSYTAKVVARDPSACLVDGQVLNPG